MSQPASPIGSVEFIVKFDSMQSSFVDALKDAMKDVEIDTGTDPQLTTKIDEILYNLRHRLRSLWTGNREQFLASAVADIVNNNTQETIKSLARDVVIKQGILPKEPGQSKEDWILASQELAKDMLDNWSLMIQNAIDDDANWEKMKDRLITWQGMMHEGMNLGRWPSRTKLAYGQIIKEDVFEKKFREVAKEADFDIIAQKAFAPTPFEIDITEGTGPKKQIEDYLQLTNILAKRGISGTQITKQMQSDPGKGLDDPTKEAAIDLLKDYIIVDKSKMPNIFQQTWRAYLKEKNLLQEKEYPIKGGTRPDFSFIIENTLKSVETFRKAHEKAGYSPQAIQEIINIARKELGLTKDQEFGTPVEGKKVEIIYEQLSEEATKKLNEQLKEVLSSKEVSGISKKEKHDLERQEKELNEQLKGIKKIIESTYQKYVMFERDFKPFITAAVRQALLAKGSKGAEAVTLGQGKYLVKIGDELRPIEQTRESAAKKLSTTEIIRMQKYGTMLKGAIQDKNVDLIEAFRLMLKGLTSEEKAIILKEK